MTSDVMTTGAGLGASSSLMTALVCACREFRGEAALAPEELAMTAYHLETEAGTVGGLQDQYAAASGGFNSITFSHDGVAVEAIHMAQGAEEAFCQRLFLVYTNLARKQGDIQTDHKRKIIERDRIDYLDQILSLSYEFEEELVKPSPDFDVLGTILHENWMMKRNFNSAVTNSYVDQLYEYLRENGMVGGKITGAGGGGFILALAREGAKESLMYKLYPNFLALSFSFTRQGVQIVWKNWY